MTPKIGAIAAAALAGLTSDQRRWYRQVAEVVPDEAWSHVLRKFKVPKHQQDDLRQEAFLGMVEGVKTFDPAGGSSLKTWTYFKSLYFVLTARRRDRRAQLLAAALNAAAVEAERPVDVLYGTPASFGNAIVDISAHTVASMVAALTELPTDGTGEDALIEREIGLAAAALLRETLGDLSPERRQALERVFADDLDIKELAVERGAAYRSQRKELRQTIKLLAARFRGRGFQHLPTLPEETANTILSSAPSAKNEGPEGP